jgi:hypothetical protein
MRLKAMFEKAGESCWKQPGPWISIRSLTCYCYTRLRDYWEGKLAYPSQEHYYPYIESIRRTSSKFQHTRITYEDGSACLVSHPPMAIMLGKANLNKLRVQLLLSILGTFIEFTVSRPRRDKSRCCCVPAASG